MALQAPADLLAAREQPHAHRLEKLPLLDDQGTLRGLITAQDIMRLEQHPQAIKDGKGRLRVGAAVGARSADLERAEACLHAGADTFVVDIAHGHSENCMGMVRALKERWPEVPVIAGNVATPEGVPVVSWDFERNRTWVMKMHEFVDPAYRIVGVEVQKLQKVIQELSPRSHRKLPKYLHAFAYDKRLKRSMQSDAIDKALFLYVDSGGDAGAGIRSRFRQMAQMQISDPNGYIRIMRIPPGPMAARIKSNPHRLHLKETLRLLDMVDNFTQGHKDFANVMSNRFRDAGALANRHGLLKSFVDNYVRRQYLMRKGEEIEPSGTGHGFKTYFSPAFPRYYDYVLDAILDGFELRNKGITTAYQSYMEELVRVIGNKQFIRVGMATVGADGNKLFTTNKRQGYKPLKGFTVWTWAGHVEATKEVYGQPALTIDDYGKRFFATPISEVPEMFYVYKTPTATKASKIFDDINDANAWLTQKRRQNPREYSEARIEKTKPKDTAELFEKKDLYAPKPIAELINKMTATDTLFRIEGLNTLLRLNLGVKTWILLSSFFHHMAGTREWTFAIHHGWKPTTKLFPWVAYKAGLKKLEDLHPLIILGVKNGLTLGEIADFAEGALRSNKPIALRIAEKFGLERTSRAIEWGRFKRESFTDSLFKKFFAGLKAEAFVIEYSHILQKEIDRYNRGRRQDPPDPDRIAELVASRINSNFGGLHLRRLGRNPTLQNIARVFLLAPDWTESNFRIVTGWLRLNPLISKMIGDIPEAKGMEKIYGGLIARAWLRIAVITILAQVLLNGKDETEEFWNDQILSNRWNRFRWTELDITKLYKALGIPTEGERVTFSIGGHYLDPLKAIDPARLFKAKGSPFFRLTEALLSGSDWAERPYTGFKELISTGKTVKRSFHQEKESFFERLPSTIINQIINMQPVQVGYVMRYLQGEEDALSALLHSMGAAVHKAWRPRLEGPIEKRKEGVDYATPIIEDLKKKGLLNMGPPARMFTIKKDRYEMDRNEWNEYVSMSSEIAHRRIQQSVEAGNYDKMSDTQKAKRIQSVILTARKQAPSKPEKGYVKG